MTKTIPVVATIIGIVILLALSCAVVFVLECRVNALEAQLKQATIQNVQLTKTMREEKAEAFRDGLITCGNEDVKWLDEQADYYNSLAGSNPLSKLMREWAQTWAYDDATLDEMTETYMNGDSH